MSATSSSSLGQVDCANLEAFSGPDHEKSHKYPTMEKIVRHRTNGREIAVGSEEEGVGPTLVLLPAQSSISTRHEMDALFERFKTQNHTVSVDWPGFGERSRPKMDWTPDLLSDFLHQFLAGLQSQCHVLIAAGHAATYALYETVHRPGIIERLVLIAPSWRGPLPTALDGPRRWFAHVRSLMDTPIVGQMLYRLNVSRPVVSKMVREHVYSDPRFFSGERLRAKLAITRAAGSRHGSVRFVTGALDRVSSREAFLDLFRRAKVPILVIYGEETPRKSRSEMDAIAAVPSVRVSHLPKGKLSIHEEFPDEVVGLIRPFLQHSGNL